MKWSEVEWSYGEVLGVEFTIYIRVTLHWGYLILLWLFYLVCTLYCSCFKLFCNVWVSECVSVCVWGGEGCFGNMCTCIDCVLVLFVLCFCIVSFTYISSYLFCLY